MRVSTRTATRGRRSPPLALDSRQVGGVRRPPRAPRLRARRRFALRLVVLRRRGRQGGAPGQRHGLGAACTRRRGPCGGERPGRRRGPA